MENVTVPVTTEEDEFDLDVTFIESAVEAPEARSNPCTGDNCGGTNESACVTC